MRKDAIFIGVEVDDGVDAALGAKLEEVCPVNIYKGTSGGVDVVEQNLDECVLCRLCIDASPQGSVTVRKLYDGGAVL